MLYLKGFYLDIGKGGTIVDGSETVGILTFVGIAGALTVAGRDVVLEVTGVVTTGCVTIGAVQETLFGAEERVLILPVLSAHKYACGLLTSGADKDHAFNVE